MIVGASLDETVPVPCHVAADPLDVSFDWNFSNSGERFEVTSGQFNLLQDFHSSSSSLATGDGSSGPLSGMPPFYDGAEESSETIYELLYTPKSERDYGTLACWGKNSIGKQLEPCLFQVVPAAKPAPLRNCTLRPYSTLLAATTQNGGGPGSVISNSSAASASSSSSSATFYYGAGAGAVGDVPSSSSSSSSESAAAASFSDGASASTIGQHYRESNYISTQFVKDRNVSSERANITKFNQKNGGGVGGGSSSRKREQIKQKNITHHHQQQQQQQQSWGGSGGKRISAASHNVGLTSDESDELGLLGEDPEMLVEERGEVRMAAQILSSLGTASGPGPGPSGSSFSSSAGGSFPGPEERLSSLPSSAAAENRRKTISNNERNSGMNLYNGATLLADGSFLARDAARTASSSSSSLADANHGRARMRREQRFNENLENEINKTRFDDDDEIFNSTNRNSLEDDEDDEGLRTLKSTSGINGGRSNYPEGWRETPPKAEKLQSDNIRYNRYHSAAEASGGGKSGHPKPASPPQNSNHNAHPYSHHHNLYMENLLEVPTTLELECVAGYDGGLPQHFFLEAYDSRTRKLRLNITSALNDVPLFRIDLSELIPSDSYTPTLHLIAYSVNQKGRSDPTILEDIAINEAEKRTGWHINEDRSEAPTFKVSFIMARGNTNAGGTKVLDADLAMITVVFVPLSPDETPDA
ncbi:uncharacterized protein LOC129737868 [Uranotaenia lowii]|uniref:uncharacterized protein LOC129737868 n=1 Tax=Uranotaenia lowii TaxID=190385 RepID=UPI00247A3F54|nr:uncharacterized protein LOC129737868 [Uranotaenia lowii]